MSLKSLCLSILFPFFQGEENVDKLTFQLINVSVERAIEEVRVQTGKSFFFDTNDVDLAKKVTIKAKQSTLPVVLNKIFINQNLVCKIVNNHIIITKKEIGKPQAKDILTVRGRVTDIEGDPLGGVHVRTAQSSTITDVNGYYTIASEATGLLTFSYIGYQDRTLKVNNRSTLSVKLIISEAALTR